MGSLLAYSVSQVSYLSFGATNHFLRSLDEFLRYAVVRG